MGWGIIILRVVTFLTVQVDEVIVTIITSRQGVLVVLLLKVGGVSNLDRDFESRNVRVNLELVDGVQRGLVPDYDRRVEDVEDGCDLIKSRTLNFRLRTLFREIVRVAGQDFLVVLGKANLVPILEDQAVIIFLRRGSITGSKQSDVVIKINSPLIENIEEMGSIGIRDSKRLLASMHFAEEIGVSISDI